MAAAQSDDWQDGKSLVECNCYMLENEIADVTFDVTYTQGEIRCPTVQIRALKTLLMARSSVFDAMFCGELKETAQVIEVTDVEPEAFKELLRYIYTDEVHLTTDNVLAVIYAAKKYMVSALTKICVEYIEKSLSHQNALSLLDQGIFFEVNELIVKSIEKIQSEASDILKSAAFANISQEAFHEVFKSNTMNASELEVFNAGIKWAENRCKKEGKGSTAEHIRSVLGDNLFLIRFPAMTVDEFNEYVVPTDILSVAEAYQVVMQITAKVKPKKMPFLSTRRVRLVTKKPSQAFIHRPDEYNLKFDAGEKTSHPYNKLLETHMQCISSRPIRIHKVLIHAAQSSSLSEKSVSLIIRQKVAGLANNDIYHGNYDELKATKISGNGYLCYSLDVEDFVTGKGIFEIFIGLSIPYFDGKYYTIQNTLPSLTLARDNRVTVELNSKTKHNILCEIRYSLL